MAGDHLEKQERLRNAIVAEPALGQHPALQRVRLMAFSATTILALAAQCASNVAPATVAAIVMTESRGRPLAINVNGGVQPRPQTDAMQAAAVARRYVAAGYSVDLGLGQINSRNMRKLGLTWATVFDPCTNIAALGRILTGNYEVALSGREPQAALRVAFSLYNTGSPSRGFRNGYVGKVVGNAGTRDAPTSMPSVLAADVSDERPSIIAENTTGSPAAAEGSTAPPSWNLFGRAAYLRSATLPSEPIRRTSVWAQ